MSCSTASTDETGGWGRGFREWEWECVYLSQCDRIWLNFATFAKKNLNPFWHSFEGLFSNWHNFEPYF